MNTEKAGLTYVAVLLVGYKGYYVHLVPLTQVNTDLTTFVI